ncbi:hypothetical protein COB28_04395 [Candidatus Dependentiae bacterium]|nr:MAG: hypothetical protein COB28_04395 [Candidatus Dependentiae bacterium]
MKKVMISILLTSLFFVTPDLFAAAGSRTIDEQFLDASRKGNIGAVKAFLLDGADLNTKNVNGNVALHLVSFEGYGEIASFVLENGASKNIQDKDGDTPLNWAAFFGRSEIVMFLLQHDADKSIQDKHGNTALHFAVCQGHVEITKILLSFYADARIKNRKGEMPIDLVKDKSSNLFKILEQASAPSVKPAKKS